MDTEKEKKDNDTPQQQIIEMGSTVVKNNFGRIHCLTVVGQIEGHMLAPQSAKTTKYEHVLPLLAGIEAAEDIDGLLVLLNTVGGDVEAGLSIAEMIAGMEKPTVTLVLGGGHSIGIPLAVSGKVKLIAPSASMTVHPVRMSGTVIAAEETYRYFERLQERIIRFVDDHAKISADRFRTLMLQSGDMANDVGTVLYGEEAVKEGLMDQVGTLHDAYRCLYEQIEKQKS